MASRHGGWSDAVDALALRHRPGVGQYVLTTAAATTELMEKIERLKREGCQRRRAGINRLHRPTTRDARTTADRHFFDPQFPRRIRRCPYQTRVSSRNTRHQRRATVERMVSADLHVLSRV